MIEISITALISVLLLLVEHWAPTRLLLGRKLPNLAAYILGVLALILPLTGLLIYWGEHRVILALWLIVVSGGAAVILAYMVDAWLEERVRACQAIEREQELLRVIQHGTDDQG